MGQGRATTLRAATVCAAVAVIGGGVAPAASTPSLGEVVAVDVLSNRADLVSGGDALVEMRAGTGH